MSSEFLRIKGILDKIPATQDETRIISEVLRIKTTLVKSGDESVLYDSLTKLQCMSVSVKILEATGIGKSVGGFKNHARKDIKRISRMLIRAWRLTVDEWITAIDNMQSSRQQKDEEDGESKKIPTSKHQEPKVINQHKLERTKRKVQERSLQPPKLLKSETIVPKSFLNKRSTIEEKFEATKRKLQQRYNEAENMKKMRRTQVLEVHDVLRLGFARKHRDSRFGKRSNSCSSVGLVR